MHYYKRNLGDYAKKAGRLTMLQHGAYTLLIDACYDREQFPTREEAIDWTWASSTAEVEAVDFVLAKFFTLEDGRYVQKRIQEEIAAYHETSETNKRIASEREAKRRESSTKRVRTVDEPPPNQEPRTKNQEPLTNNQESRERERTPNGARLPADWQLPDDWAAWAKQTRPDLNPNETAQRFADYWHGVPGAKGRKADWLATWRNWVRGEKDPPARHQQAESFRERDDRLAREKVAAVLPGIAAKAPAASADVIDVTPMFQRIGT